MLHLNLKLSLNVSLSLNLRSRARARLPEDRMRTPVAPPRAKQLVRRERAACMQPPKAGQDLPQRDGASGRAARTCGTRESKRLASTDRRIA